MSGYYAKCYKHLYVFNLISNAYETNYSISRSIQVQGMNQKIHSVNEGGTRVWRREKYFFHCFHSDK